MSGDLIPILEPRWAKRELPQAKSAPTVAASPAPKTPEPAASARADFPQFLGPHRTAVINGVTLDADWAAHPPQIVWRQKIGAGWSGFVIVGNRAITQEQRGEEELVTCYDLSTGQLLWSHADAARYFTPIAGEGPRATPTVVSNRVFTLGSTGILNCLDLASGKSLWTHNITTEAGAKVPDWGYAGSPLMLDGKVIVSAGGEQGKSMLGYRADSGELAWSAGNTQASYGTPFAATLAGTRQILIFNQRRVTSHDAQSGAVLWDYPFGAGMPNVSIPVVIGPDEVVFSSGYGVGSELLHIRGQADGKLAAERVWESKKMKAKFANLVAHEGFLYGLDDGILACVDLKDGSQRWKEGRYGHGQGLWIGDLYLLMAENGELVLLRPTPDKPNELHRFRVFDSKTWNPIAISGEWLLVRNDLEAACLKVALKK
ncbi:MAG TPA: PQQ-binding-like beta-propeller repeat protein [Verrucomicrobiae bacterium]|nr:PQQ-binding-like beta-propeller repeat protein [Verrucomicrobiae bacterium]